MLLAKQSAPSVLSKKNRHEEMYTTKTVLNTKALITIEAATKKESTAESPALEAYIYFAGQIFALDSVVVKCVHMLACIS